VGVEQVAAGRGALAYQADYWRLESDLGGLEYLVKEFELLFVLYIRNDFRF
jgi:hypothetical protein